MGNSVTPDITLLPRSLEQIRKQSSQMTVSKCLLGSDRQPRFTGSSGEGSHWGEDLRDSKGGVQIGGDRRW